MNNYNFDNFMKFLIWIKGVIGIFFMYKCLSTPKASIWLCLIAGITIVCILLVSSILLTNSLNGFYYDIADLDESVKKLNSTIKTRQL